MVQGPPVPEQSSFSKRTMMEAREFEYTEQDFRHIREFVHHHTGIALSEAKREMVYSRLSRRLRALGLHSFAEYRTRLESDEQEIEHFTNAITTNLTAFFREPHHFEFLGRTVLQELATRASGGRRLRIWSAGCSTGEEVYSIAMTVRENLPAYSQWDVKLLATDLDSSVLEVGEQGIYPAERIAKLPSERVKRWFLRGSGSAVGKVRVNDELRAMVAFRQLNLMQPWPMRNGFDVIFCRNVVIYFDKPTQAQLFNRFADALHPGGYLFIGHSETLSNLTDRFQSLGKTIYRKIR